MIKLLLHLCILANMNKISNMAWSPGSNYWSTRTKPTTRKIYCFICDIDNTSITAVKVATKTIVHMYPLFIGHFHGHLNIFHGHGTMSHSHGIMSHGHGPMSNGQGTMPMVRGPCPMVVRPNSWSGDHFP